MEETTEETVEETPEYVITWIEGMRAKSHNLLNTLREEQAKEMAQAEAKVKGFDHICDRVIEAVNSGVDFKSLEEVEKWVQGA